MLLKNGINNSQMLLMDGLYLGLYFIIAAQIAQDTQSMLFKWAYLGNLSSDKEKNLMLHVCLHHDNMCMIQCFIKFVA